MLLEVKALHGAYGESKVLHGLDFVVEEGGVTALLGANGAGKSSLISFFKMLNAIISETLHPFVEKEGRASSLLHYGAKVTSRITAFLEFSDGDRIIRYIFVLTHSSGDRFIIHQEYGAGYKKSDNSSLGHSFAIGKPESALESPIGDLISVFLKNCQVYQFHDTTLTARINNSIYINDNQFLRQDGGNLAAFLFALKENEKTTHYYDKIVRHIRTVFPQFGDFVLNPSPLNENYITIVMGLRSEQLV